MAIYTTEQYNALVTAIALGVTEVNYGNKKVVYRSLNEMLRLKSEMESDLGLSSFNKRKRYIQHSKGLR